jgi:fluoride exporter
VKLALWVALGGAAGCVARHGATLALARVGAGFPWGTLAVNVVGSFVLAALVAAGEPRVSPEWRAAIGTGFCGGFTTFSTFSVDTLQMPVGLAAANVAANLALSFGAAFAGFAVGRLLRG